MIPQAISPTVAAAGLSNTVDDELALIEERLGRIDRVDGIVGRGVDSFLKRRGKRLRPRCVLLAASMGSGVSPAARDLALAAELVHSATLLHDDVIDESPQRRGAQTVGATLGSSVSILAGDWLLMKGLDLVHRAQVPEALSGLIAVVSDMIAAESLQLEGRSDGSFDRSSYRRIARQKTAGLFQWSLEVGGRAGGLSEQECRPLRRVGLHLGVGFQIADDLRELVADSKTALDELSSDLRLGIKTYPLVLALERRPELLNLVQRVVDARPDETVDACRELVASMLSLEVVEDSRRALNRHRQSALEALRSMPEVASVEMLTEIVKLATSADASLRKGKFGQQAS